MADGGGTEVGVGYVRLLPSMRGFGREVGSGLGPELDGPLTESGKKAGGSFLTGLSSGLNSAGSKMSGLGSQLSVGLTLPLVGAGYKATQLASDLNESMSKVNTVFGDAAGGIQMFADDAAKSLGLSKGAALDAAGGFGNLFTQLGINQQGASDMSQQIVGLAADFSSFHNADISEVLEAQSAAFRGEYDSLQKFVPLINAAMVEEKALAMTGKDSADSLTAQEKALATYQLMLEGAGAARGDFARTAEGDANATRIAAAEAENAAAVFGQKLLPVKAKLIEAATNLLDWYNRLSPAQQDMAMKGLVVAAALGPVLKVVGMLTQTLSATVKAVQLFGKGTATVVRGGIRMGKAMGPAIKAFGRLGMAALRAGANVIKAGARMAIAAVKATAKVVAQIAVQVAKWIWMGIQSLLAAAKVALAWIISLGPIALVGAALIAIAALIIANFDTVKQWVTAAFDWIVEKAQAVWNWVSTNWATILAILTGPIGIAVAMIVKYWDQISAGFTAVKDWIWARVEDVVSFITGIPERVMSFLDTLWTAWKDGMTAVSDWILARADDIVGFITGINDRVLGFLDTLWTAWKDGITSVKDWVSDRIDDIVNFFANIPGRVSTAISGVADKIKKPFTDAFDAIKSAWNRTVGGFGFDVPSWVPGVGGKSFKIPKMHTGGIFTPPPGEDEGYAMLRRGEGVFTPEQMSALPRFYNARPAETRTDVRLIADGLDRSLLEWLRRSVRVQGRGNVQVALGTGAGGGR